MKQKPKKTGRNTAFFLAFAALFCVSAYMIASQLMTDRAEQQAFADLLAQVNVSPEPGATPQDGAQDAQSATGSQDATGARDTQSTQDAEGSQQATDGQSETSAASQDGAQEAQSVTGAQGGTSARDTQSTQDAQGSQQATDGQDVTGAQGEPDVTPEPPVLSAYAALYAQNPDLFGWIEIEGTGVNFPVMYTPRDSEYYLHRAFDGTSSFSGVPFMDGSCYVDCGNYLIYGHHMKNGTMFAPIVGYAKEDFWREHPLIQFNTIYEEGTYEVFAAFYGRVNTWGAFRYYEYLDLKDPKRFEEYVYRVKAESIYDTQIEPVFGEELITLSTCEYHREDGRFIVVARKIEKQPDGH